MSSSITCRHNMEWICLKLVTSKQFSLYVRLSNASSWDWALHKGIYIARFSASEQAHYTLVVCDSEWVTVDTRFIPCTSSQCHFICSHIHRVHGCLAVEVLSLHVGKFMIFYVLSLRSLPIVACETFQLDCSDFHLLLCRCDHTVRQTSGAE